MAEFTKEQFMASQAKNTALLEKYAHLISKKNCGLDISPGWYDIVERLFEILEASGFKDIRVQQIKEKFGGLRFYYEGGDRGLYDKIEKVESQAYQTCDICSAEGEVTNSESGWRITRCKEHARTAWPEITAKDWSTLDKARNKIKNKFSPEEE